jgi:hypothetical protein
LNVYTVAVGGVVSASLFFVITNFGVWFAGRLYTRDFQGLVDCYTAALPFFRNTLLSDIVYSLLLFAAYQTFIVSAKWAERTIFISAASQRTLQ